MQLYDKLMLTNALLLDENMFFCPTPNCISISEIVPPESE